MPYRLDLVTLLARDLNAASAQWTESAGFSRCAAGKLPAELALRIGQPAMAGANWIALSHEGINPRLRLIEFAASESADAGWGAIRISHEPEPTAARVVVDLHAKDTEVSSAFYLGLLGARRIERELRLPGASLRLCAIGDCPSSAPFALRFQRYRECSEAIGTLTELPRCLSGPQGEYIELI